MSELHESYKKTTILFPIDETGIILGMKKLGFGEGWWNGFGGKLEEGETYEEAAIRETFEESGLHVRSLFHVANLHFYFNDVLRVVSKAYISKDFEGQLVETSEMQPRYFDFKKIPYDTMWPADGLWIPRIVSAPTQPLGFVVRFDEDQRFISIEEVDPVELEIRF